MTDNDTISRKEVTKLIKYWYEGLVIGNINGLIKRIEAMPSVEPMQKKGVWRFDKEREMSRCSECGGAPPFYPVSSAYYESAFCPHCGACMTEEREEENE